MTISKKIFYSTELEVYLLLSSLIITIFFGFIDEGYYTFSWMLEIVPVIVLSLYGLAIYIIQFLLFKLLLGSYPSVGKIFSLAVSADLIVWMIWLY